MQIVTLDMGLLVAGTKYRGEFEERLKKLMDEVKQNDDVILVGGGTGGWHHVSHPCTASFEQALCRRILRAPHLCVLAHP